MKAVSCRSITFQIGSTNEWRWIKTYIFSQVWKIIENCFIVDNIVLKGNEETIFKCNYSLRNSINRIQLTYSVKSSFIENNHNGTRGSFKIFVYLPSLRVPSWTYWVWDEPHWSYKRADFANFLNPRNVTTSGDPLTIHQSSLAKPVLKELKLKLELQRCKFIFGEFKNVESKWFCLRLQWIIRI